VVLPKFQPPSKLILADISGFIFGFKNIYKCGSEKSFKSENSKSADFEALLIFILLSLV